MTITNLARFVAVLCLFTIGDTMESRAQTIAGQRSADGIWSAVSGRPSGLAQRDDITGESAVVLLDKTALDARLAYAPREGDRDAAPAIAMTLPMPGGAFARFAVVESPMLAPELAAAFPHIRTYQAQGIDDPTATARLGWTDRGFHAIVLSASGTAYVDPYARGNTAYYVAYYKQDRPQGEAALMLEDVHASEGAGRIINEFPIAHGDALRTYRLALAATGEYTAAAGGTKPLALARMVATVNRVNGIFEREVAIRLILSTGHPGDATALIYDDGATDPYSNDDRVALTEQNQSHLDAVIGSANYDLGHVFARSNGGWTYFGACQAATKARAASGLTIPGDAFDVNMAAHEFGHQFVASHTFNGLSDLCGTGQRVAASAFEVGSGSTIMSYVGGCASESLQRFPHDVFHVESLNQITAFVTSAYGACGVVTPTGNLPPTVTGPGDFTVPTQTPFTLTATAADANGDALTFSWEEYDLGTESDSAASASTDDGSRPLFRSYAPTASPTRTFPSLSFVMNNGNVPPQTYPCSLGTCLTGETLPVLGRALKFHVTVRDNRAGGGGIATAMSTLTVDGTSGPFRVTSPNAASSYVGGSAQTVTWETNGTNVPPINTTSVRILLSTDGGLTFPSVLLASTPNDGSQPVVIPNVATGTARIKVEAVGNVFFDVSDINFSVTPGTDPPPPPPPPGVGTPANFAASVTGNNVTFTWTAGAGTLPITSYLLEGGVVPGQAMAHLPVPFVTTSVVAPVPTGVFFVRVYALSDGVASAASNEVQIFVNVPAPPSPPTNLLGLVNGSSLALSWTNPASGGTPTSLMLDVSGTLATSVPLAVAETFSFAGVPPGTYTFSVRAVNAAGASPATPPVTLTFPGACSGPPLTPGNFRVEKAGNLLMLSWLPPASGPAVTDYVLNVSGAFTGAVPVPVRGISGWVGPGSYTISLAARNACGSSQPTSTQTVEVP